MTCEYLRTRSPSEGYYECICEEDICPMYDKNNEDVSDLDCIYVDNYDYDLERKGRKEEHI